MSSFSILTLAFVLGAMPAHGDDAPADSKNYSLEYLESLIKTPPNTTSGLPTTDPNNANSTTRTAPPPPPPGGNAAALGPVIVNTPNYVNAAPAASGNPPQEMGYAGLDGCAVCAALKMPGNRASYAGACANISAFDPTDPGAVSDRCDVVSGKTCPNGTNYMSSQLDRIFDTPDPATASDTALKMVLQDQPPAPAIPTACFAEVLAKAPARKNSRLPYAQCEKPPGTSDYINFLDSKKPCTSSRLVELTADSFNSMADCLQNFFANEDQGPNDANAADSNRFEMLRLFALMKEESGFEMNIPSGSFMYGIGQFGGAAAEDVNKNVMPEMTQYLAQNGSPRCQAMANLLDTSRNESRYRQEGYYKRGSRPPKDAVCDRVSIDNGQPLVGMLYTAAYFQTNRRTAHTILSNPVYQSVFGTDRMTPTQRAAVESEVALWGHNLGGPRMKTFFKEALNSMSPYDEAAQLRSGNPQSPADLLRERMQAIIHQNWIETKGSRADPNGDPSLYLNQLHRGFQDVIHHKVGGVNCFGAP